MLINYKGYNMKIRRMMGCDDRRTDRAACERVVVALVEAGGRQFVLGAAGTELGIGILEKEEG